MDGPKQLNEKTEKNEKKIIRQDISASDGHEPWMMDGTMISGRQYYEIPPAGQAITTSYKGNRRFDPDYGLNYGHHSYAIEQKDYRAARAVSGSGLGPAGARQSLSALDDKRANEIRHGVYAHVFLDVKNSSKSEAP